MLPQRFPLQGSPQSKRIPSGVPPFYPCMSATTPVTAGSGQYRREQSIPTITGNLLCCADWTQGEKQPRREKDHGWSWLIPENLDQRI